MCGYRGVRSKLGASWKQRQWIEEIKILDELMMGEFQQDDIKGFYLPAEILLGVRDHLNCTRGSSYWDPVAQKTKRRSGFMGLQAHADEITNEEWYHQLFTLMKKYKGAFFTVPGDPNLWDMDAKTRKIADDILEIALVRHSLLG